MRRMLRRLHTRVRSDAEYVSLLQQRLPSLFQASLHQFAPMWTATADVVAEATLSQPQNMLDLASGAAAEPALTLARRFSGATVVASDSEAGVLEMAALRVSEERLADQVELQQIDMFDLVALGGSDGDAAIADVVTCSLGLFMLPPADHELGLRGVRKLLRPGGLLVATVWDRMALMELGGRCVAKALGRAEPLELPYDPTCLGHGRADAVLRAAGFKLLDGAGDSAGVARGHNQTHTLQLDLGSVEMDDAWMLGLLSFQGTLAAVQQQQQQQPQQPQPGVQVGGVYERARLAFREEAQAAGWIEAQSRNVVVRGLDYRVLVGRRPL